MIGNAASARAEALDEKEWLHRHYDKEWLSASRVAAVLGKSKFASALRVYSELRGEVKPPDQTLPMECGHLLEPAVDALYKKETGRDTYDPGDFTIVPHPDLPWLFCTLDRVANRGEDDPDYGPLELKTTGSYNRKEIEEEEGLVEHQIQNLVQQMCTDLPWGSLAVLVGNTHFYVHDFDRYPELEELILKGLDAFHTQVLNGDAPEPGYQDAGVLKLLHPKDDGSVIAMPEAIGLIQDYEAAKKAFNDAEDEMKGFKNRLVKCIGDHSFIQAGDLRYSYKHQSRKMKAQVDEKFEGELEANGIPFKPASVSEFRVLRKSK